MNKKTTVYFQAVTNNITLKVQAPAVK